MTVVKISVSANNHIWIERLIENDSIVDGNKTDASKMCKSERFRFHGFGTFILNISEEDVEITQDAWEYLKQSIARKYSSVGDLFGLSIEEHPQSIDRAYAPLSITFGTRESTLEVPIEDVTVSPTGHQFLQQCIV